MNIILDFQKILKSIIKITCINLIFNYNALNFDINNFINIKKSK
jgi:hypothetical protein